MSFGYLILEARRAMRSTRFLIFSIVFPVLLFLLYVGIFADGEQSAVGVLMVNMTAFGALSAALFAGGRVALERSVGWQRQLRLTPLSGSGYLTAKGVTAMLLAVPAVVLVPLVGAVLEGVSLDAGGWLRVTVGIWIAVIPFALIGLLIGQVGTPDSLQPIMSITMMGMSLLGGIFIPVDSMPGWLLNVADRTALLLAGPDRSRGRDHRPVGGPRSGGAGARHLDGGARVRGDPPLPSRQRAGVNAVGVVR